MIVRHVVLAREKFEIGPCNGGQQGSELAAARAIAGDHFADFGLRFIADFSALAAAGVGFFHRSLHRYLMTTRAPRALVDARYGSAARNTITAVRGSGGLLPFRMAQYQHRQQRAPSFLPAEDDKVRPPLVDLSGQVHR